MYVFTVDGKLDFSSIYADLMANVAGNLLPNQSKQIILSSMQGLHQCNILDETLPTTTREFADLEAICDVALTRQGKYVRPIGVADLLPTIIALTQTCSFSFKSQDENLQQSYSCGQPTSHLQREFLNSLNRTQPGFHITFSLLSGVFPNILGTRHQAIEMLRSRLRSLHKHEAMQGIRTRWTSHEFDKQVFVINLTVSRK